MVSKAKNSKLKATDKNQYKTDRNLYNRLGFISAIIIAVLVPLVFAPRVTQETFSILKINLAIIASAILIIGWLIRCREENRIFISRPYYFLPLLLLGADYIISTAFSVNPMVSFFGTYVRFEGLLAMIGYLVIGLIIPTVVRRDDVDRLISALIMVGTLVSTYALLQNFGIDWQRWQGSFAGERVFSTFGNPLTLSGYIVLVFPLAFVRLLKRPGPVSIAFILLGSIALLFTYSRSGWLAFAVEVPLLAIIFFRWLRSTKSGKSGTPGISLKSRSFWVPIIISIIIFIIIAVAVTCSSDIGARLVSAFDQKTDTASARLNLWKLTLDMIQNKPFLGYGLDTFLQVSTRSLDLTQNSFEINKQYDRPHSDILQVAFSSGYVGLLVYLLFIFVYFLGVLRFLRKRRDRGDGPGDALLVAGLGLGVLGYLVSLQFYFSTVGVTPVMWLMVGLTALVIGPKDVSTGSRVPGVITLATLGFCLLLLIPNLMTLAADVMAERANRAELNGDRLAAVNSARSAARVDPWHVDYLLQYGQLLETSPDVDGAITVYKRSIEIDPEMYEGYFRLAQIYYRQNDYQTSLNYALAALERYPLKYDARLIYALVSVVNGKIDIAEENLLLLKKIDPSNYRAYYYLGVLYRDMGRLLDARLHLQEAQKLGPSDPNVKQALANLENVKK